MRNGRGDRGDGSGSSEPAEWYGSANSAGWAGSIGQTGSGRTVRSSRRAPSGRSSEPGQYPDGDGYAGSPEHAGTPEYGGTRYTPDGWPIDSHPVSGGRSADGWPPADGWGRPVDGRSRPASGGRPVDGGRSRPVDPWPPPDPRLTGPGPADSRSADPRPSESRSTGSRSRSRAALGADPVPEDEPLNWRRRASRIRKNMPLWQELPLLLVVAFCLAVLIRTFLFQAFFIPSGSMENTLLIGDRVLVNKVVYDTRAPRRGEIVVFRGTDKWAPEVPAGPTPGFMTKLGRTLGDLVGISQPGEKDFIKRVIGLPGDTVACCDAEGRVTVNGMPLNETYISENSPLDLEPSPNRCGSRRFGPITVAPGNMFVMGDHRAVSQDARCQGQVPIANVIGKAFVIVWPSAHWDTLGTPSTFDNVPKPAAAGATVPVPAGPISGVPAPSGSQPATPADTVPSPLDVALLIPLLAGSVDIARSRRARRARGRRLRA